MGWIRTGDGIHNASVFCDLEIVRHFWCLGLKLLFCGNSTFFRTFRLVLISTKPYYQNARIDRGIIFGFRRICQLTVNYQSDLAFWGFPSFLFSLHILLIYQGLSADAPHTRPGRWRSLETGALYCRLGLCLICRGFVLSVGALYSNLMYPQPI